MLGHNLFALVAHPRLLGGPLEGRALHLRRPTAKGDGYHAAHLEVGTLLAWRRLLDLSLQGEVRARHLYRDAGGAAGHFSLVDIGRDLASHCDAALLRLGNDDRHKRLELDTLERRNRVGPTNDCLAGFLQNILRGGGDVRADLDLHLARAVTVVDLDPDVVFVDVSAELGGRTGVLGRRLYPLDGSLDAVTSPVVHLDDAQRRIVGDGRDLWLAADDRAGRADPRDRLAGEHGVGHPLGGGLRGIVRCPHPEARLRAGDPAPLLDRVCQLVGEELQSGRGSRLIHAPSKRDRAANRERGRADGVRRTRRRLIRVDADAAEVVTEARLEQGARGGVQRLPA